MKTILAAIDFSDVTTNLIDTARTLAKALGCRLCLVHVLQPGGVATGLSTGLETGIVPAPMEGESQESAENRLGELKERAGADGLDVSTQLLHGAAVEQLIGQVGKMDAYLTVVGSHGHGAVYHLVVGSVTEGLLRKSPSNVLVVRAKQRSKVT
jgi:nucleotide-binding universal stress UspA family protein